MCYFLFVHLSFHSLRVWALHWAWVSHGWHTLWPHYVRPCTLVMASSKTAAVTALQSDGAWFGSPAECSEGQYVSPWRSTGGQPTCWLSAVSPGGDHRGETSLSGLLFVSMSQRGVTQAVYPATPFLSACWGHEVGCWLGLENDNYPASLNLLIFILTRLYFCVGQVRNSRGNSYESTIPSRHIC